MSAHDKKARPLRAPNKSPIATPPRAAIHGRSKTADHPSSDGASTKSTAETTYSDTEDVSPSSASMTSTLERDGDRDKRKIVELEKELATMEGEFERELTQLMHKLTNESECTQFWQQKHSALKQTYLKADTDLRLLRQEIGGMENRREDRDREIKTRISSLMLDRDAFREAYNEAMGELRDKDEEVRELKRQIGGLKSWVSSSSKVEEQITDESVGEQMRRLGNGLQNWVITNFRRVKIDTSKASIEIQVQLLHLVPTYESLALASKAHLIQTLVSRLLVKEIFSAYFIGLSPHQSSELSNVEKTLSGFGTTESMNAWRSSTLAMLRKAASTKLADFTSKSTESLLTRINSIMTSISDPSLPITEARDQSLRSLIRDAIDLSRLLRVQKAVFGVVMPILEDHQQTLFDADSMEDIGSEDEDALTGREIRCVTFPGIVKIGDENGERSHLRNVVAKIRVLCAPD